MARRRLAPELPIYEAIYRELERRSMTQYELARELRVTKQLVHNWVTAKNVPSRSYHERIATFLRVPIEDVARACAQATKVDRLTELERAMKDQQAQIDELMRLVVEYAARLESQDCDEAARAHRA